MWIKKLQTYSPKPIFANIWHLVEINLKTCLGVYKSRHHIVYGKKPPKQNPSCVVYCWASQRLVGVKQSILQFVLFTVSCLESLIQWQIHSFCRALMWRLRGSLEKYITDLSVCVFVCVHFKEATKVHRLQRSGLQKIRCCIKNLSVRTTQRKESYWKPWPLHNNNHSVTDYRLLDFTALLSNILDL